MVNITIRFPVTMSVVRRNGTTASYNYNQRGERYTRTINGFVSDQIRAIEANSTGLSYDELDARVSEVVRNTIRNKQTRINYLGAEEHYLEDEDDYDEPMAGDAEAVSFGVHADTIDNMTISVDYEMDNANSTGSIFDRMLRGAIRGPDSMYRKHDIFTEAWDEAPEGENCMVSQLFLAVTNQKRVESRKRDASGNYVDANPNATAQTPKYTLEQWHTITHDVELEMHPETLLLKEGVELSEDEMNELRRQRRMERQPELSAELDQIVIWLHDLLKKKGRKTIQEIVRSIHNGKNTWFDVLFQMWPLCANRNSVVEALVCSRPLMFYCAITRPTHIPDAISKEDVKNMQMSSHMVLWATTYH